MLRNSHDEFAFLLHNQQISFVDQPMLPAPPNGVSVHHIDKSIHKLILLIHMKQVYTCFDSSISSGLGILLLPAPLGFYGVIKHHRRIMQIIY